MPPPQYLTEGLELGWHNPSFTWKVVLLIGVNKHPHPHTQQKAYDWCQHSPSFAWRAVLTDWCTHRLPPHLLWWLMLGIILPESRIIWEKGLWVCLPIGDYFKLIEVVGRSTYYRRGILDCEIEQLSWDHPHPFCVMTADAARRTPSGYSSCDFPRMVDRSLELEARTNPSYLKSIMSQRFHHRT